ncbi:MAG TPA: penicillin acylase family protein, partial [Lysobacter sp.]|nr:penicillin acylase family protein [Lysobacter sp.]
WLGPIAVRGAGCDGATPVDFASGSNDCNPWAISTARAPLLTPTHGRLWTGNNRVVGDEVLQIAGDGGSTLGARARQIRDDLFAKRQLNEHDLLAIQLDDRAVFMQPWWQLLRDEAARTKASALSDLAVAAATWQGHASTDSVSYRVARAWRKAVHDRVLDGLTGPAQVALGKDFVMPGLQEQEGFVWPLVTQRPPHLLSPRYATWDALLEDAAREVRDGLKAEGPLAQRTWGEQNTAKICHPLARALPSFTRGSLCMPFDPLPGDVAMPRVQHPDFGASERMVVSPGHEAEGIIHMPGGQSGHPLSEFWGAGHGDWVQGRATPFLPGVARYTLRLQPAHRTPQRPIQTNAARAADKGERQ